MVDSSSAGQVKSLSLHESLDLFQSEGFVELGPVIKPEMADELRLIIEERYTYAMGSGSAESDFLRNDICLMRVFEAHALFRDILARRETLDLVEMILGPDCHVIAQNALRTPPGRGIVNWHIDDALYFPFLRDQARYAGGDIPCFALNVMIALTDIETLAEGPTQVVRGSHLSGERPTYGQELPASHCADSIFCQMGEAYLVNSQTWHRGAQNTSGQTRYLLTTTYGRRFISQRFYPFLNYRLPQDIIDTAPEEVLRLLGKHEKGPYG
ncbi:MAG: phytanoyl-CoA dioxygenase family protein [Angustibacter sp.]